MIESPYRILGAGIPKMLGRSKLAAQLRDRLAKPTPDHSTVVGPRHYGKTVLLKDLADEFAGGKGEYLGSVYWDMRHNTPKSHLDFLARLAKMLKASLLDGSHCDLGECLSLDDKNVFDGLELVKEELCGRNARMLIVMDGFDHVLANDSIGLQTWDSLRTLSQGQELIMVTGSRRGLRELCRTDVSATSDFWEVFNANPLRVGRFRQEDDWDSLTKPFAERGVVLDRSAFSEVFNWSGGIPTLVMLLLNGLFEQVQNGRTIGKPEVDRVAHSVATEYRDIIASLWDDCDNSLKETYLDLRSKRQVPNSEVGSGHREELLQRGLARQDGTLIKATGLLVGQYVEQQSGNLETLRGIFGDRERFLSNAKSLLEIRFQQVPYVDKRLHQFIRAALASLSEESMALTYARNIANRALELIWEREAPKCVFPDRWQIENKQPGDPIPAGGGAINILRQVTGTDRSPQQTQCITKRTYVLVSFVHSVGDHGQHLPDGEGTGPYVVAYCLAAIELAESLALDLGSS